MELRAISAPRTVESISDVTVETSGEYITFESALAAERQRMAEVEAETAKAERSGESALTAGKFREVLSVLDASVKANPLVGYEEWQNSSEYGALTRVLERLGDKGGEQPLEPYQADVLRYMNLRARLNAAQSMVDLEGQDEAQAIEELAAFARERQVGLPESEKQALLAAIRSMSGTHGRLRSAEGVKKPTGTELMSYVRLADEDANKEAVGFARNEMLFAVRCMAQDRDTYGFLAAKFPRGASQGQAVESDEIRAARENQESARTELAELYARRQKRVYGVDWMSSAHFNKQAKRFRRARSDYQLSLEEQLAQELNGRTLSAKSLNKHLATRAVRLAGDFSGNIDDNYRTNNRWAGKAINFLGGYNEKGEKSRSVGRALGKIALHSAAIGTATFLTVASGGSLLAVGAGGAWAGANAYSYWEAKKRAERMQRNGNQMNEEKVATQLKLLDTIYGSDSDETVRLTPMELVRAKIGDIAKSIVNAAEHDTVRQQKRRLGRVAASAAAGTAVAVGGHYLVA